MTRPAPPRRPAERPRAAEILAITFVPDPRGPTLRERIAKVIGARTLAGLAGVVAVVIVVAATSGARYVRERDEGPAGVAAAYHYPLRCLSVTISAEDPAYARAELNRVSPCWRYGAYVTAVFHRVGGTWRLVLDAPRYACPLASLPAPVQADLALCPKPAASGAGGCLMPVPVSAWIWREAAYACWVPRRAGRRVRQVSVVS